MTATMSMLLQPQHADVRMWRPVMGVVIREEMAFIELSTMGGRTPGEFHSGTTMKFALHLDELKSIVSSIQDVVDAYEQEEAKKI